MSPTISPILDVDTQAPQLVLTPTSSAVSSISSNSSSSSFNTTCPTCLIQFTQRRSLISHVCRFLPDETLIGTINPVILKNPVEWHQTSVIFGRNLADFEVLRICQLQKWHVKGWYPFVFPGQFRSGAHGIPPLLQLYTAGNESTKLLSKMLRVENVILPKYALLVDENIGLRALLTPDFLRPPHSFHVTETCDTFVVHREPIQQPTNVSSQLTTQSPRQDINVNVGQNDIPGPGTSFLLDHGYANVPQTTRLPVALNNQESSDHVEVVNTTSQADNSTNQVANDCTVEGNMSNLDGSDGDNDTALDDASALDSLFPNGIGVNVDVSLSVANENQLTTEDTPPPRQDINVDIGQNNDPAISFHLDHCYANVPQTASPPVPVNNQENSSDPLGNDDTASQAADSTNEVDNDCTVGSNVGNINNADGDNAAAAGVDIDVSPSVANTNVSVPSYQDFLTPEMREHLSPFLDPGIDGLGKISL